MNDSIRLEGRLYVAGARGYSNYEIAVQNGFVGTEQEWLDSMFDHAGEMASEAVIDKILDGTFYVSLVNTYNPNTQELFIDLQVVNGGGE